MTDLPQGWREQSFAQSFLTPPIGNKKLKVKECLTEGAFPVIDQGEVFITGYTNEEDLVTRVDDFVIVFGDHTRCLKYVTFDFVCGADGVKVLKPMPELDGQFAFYMLLSTELRSKGYARHLSLLKSRTFLIPTLIEQERIVEILEEQFSRLDSALASVKAVREKSKAFRRSLLHSAFSGELTGGTEGWREVELGEVCEYVRGVTYGKTDATDKPTKGFLPLLRATNIDDGRLVLTEFVYVPESKVKPVQMLQSGDLVMAASSGSIQVVGKSAPVPLGFIGTFGAFCAVLRPNHDTNQQFLNFFITSPKVRETWSAAARGTNINNLKREPVLSTQIPLPALVEQERIVEILEEQFSRLDKALEVANQLEARIASERRSLLHAAFTGELTSQWRKTHV